MNPKIIVLDTNILISAVLSPQGSARKALDKAYKYFYLVQSEETYQELITRIYKARFDKYISNLEREKFLNVLKENSLFIKVESIVNDCRDADDNKFLALAKDSKASYLVTGDKDLLVMKSIKKYRSLVVTVQEFLIK
ncbi:MAG: putative toxin-antitoxin system toxin component, PIN family [Cyanobacterium sp. T60_A2020_053]|nr:putative toxin-antitoxin system toxin component, PIN family [Cyanobacterium sp. T60_A2020_053]